MKSENRKLSQAKSRDIDQISDLQFAFFNFQMNGQND